MAVRQVRRIQRIGGSYYFTLPRTYLASLKLMPKDYVTIELRSDKIIIRPCEQDRNIKEEI